MNSHLRNLLVGGNAVASSFQDRSPAYHCERLADHWGQAFRYAVRSTRRPRCHIRRWAPGLWTVEDHTGRFPFPPGDHCQRARARLALVCGLVVASVSMSGDLISSFLKRRLSFPPSSRATGIDQIPESLLPTMAIRSTIGLSAFDVASVVVIFSLWQMLLSRLLFRWNIRKRPY